MKVNEAWTKREFLVVNMARLNVTCKHLAEMTNTRPSEISFQCTGRVKVTDLVIAAIRVIGDTLEPKHFIDDKCVLMRSDEMSGIKEKVRIIEEKIKEVKAGALC